MNLHPAPMREAADKELEELFGTEPHSRDVPAPREFTELSGDEWSELSMGLAVAIHQVVMEARGFLAGDLINITLASKLGGGPSPALRVNLWRFTP